MGFKDCLQSRVPGNLRFLNEGIWIILLGLLLITVGEADLIQVSQPDPKTYLSPALPAFARSVHSTQVSPEGMMVTNTSLIEALARIEVPGNINKIRLPIYAHLLGMDGYDYVLVKASPAMMAASGHPYTILDPDTRGATYAITSRYTSRTPSEIDNVATILFKDGRNLILKTEKNVTKTLLKAGLDIRWLNTHPMVIQEPVLSSAEAVSAITYDSRVAAMISRVSRNSLYSIVGSISGTQPVVIGGGSYTFRTRDTESGTPIRKATQYAYEYMKGRNLAVSYQNWDDDGYSCRNVIGEKKGTTRSDEIILVTAHLDSYSEYGKAPGADDDASGSAAVLHLSNIMSRYQFERTIRFVLFTGEEQGLYGSDAYAAAAEEEGENIVAVLNMDMIARNGAGGPLLRLHTRPKSNSAGYAADMVIARAFSRSVDLYGLKSNLKAIYTPDGESEADHASFWDYGYPAVLVIEEDYSDFNPYYHSSKDLRKYLNMKYFTDFTKASLATAAHLAYPAGSSAVLPVAKFSAHATRGPSPLSV